MIAGLCIGFVVVRAESTCFAYLRDQPGLRSGAWTLGMVAIGLLMILAIVGPR